MLIDFLKSLKDPEHPLRQKAFWITLIETVKNIAILLGFQAEFLALEEAAVAFVGTTIAELLVLIKKAEEKVTPMANPKDYDGVKLVRDQN